MSIVISFRGSRAPARYDGTSFTQVRVQQSTSQAGPWTTIDTLPVPVDSTPETGDVHDFTTPNGTLEDGWYRLQWVDTGGSTVSSAPVKRVPPAEGIPTPSQIRAWAPPAFDWDGYGFPAGDGDEALAARITQAIGLFYAVTGRTVASITSPEEVGMLQKVLVAFVISEVVGGGEAALAALDAPFLKSFSAGSYSETRFSPAELAGAKGAPPWPPALWALLWALMTDEKRDDWLERLSGQHRPAGGMIEMDWGADWDDGSSARRAYGSGIDTGWW